MKDILQRVADDNEIVIEKMEVMPDHVHMLIFISTEKISSRRNQSTKRQKCIPILTNTSRKLDKNNIGAVIYGLLAII